MDSILNLEILIEANKCSSGVQCSKPCIKNKKKDIVKRNVLFSNETWANAKESNKRRKWTRAGKASLR